MPDQTIFQRYELKYLLTPEQKHQILAAMTGRMAPDQYGRTTIRNLYFDTDSYQLIRRSIEKPAYKEKLRIRSYSEAGPDGTVFVELKKKYDSVVYKRRLRLSERTAMDWVSGRSHPHAAQIVREIDYFLGYYPHLHPVVFLSYDRQAYYALDGSDFRVTFDENILCRRQGLSLGAGIGGTALLPPGKLLMEIKCSGGIPLWMVRVLSRERIYKTSFSKYGTAYQTMIYPELQKGIQHHA